MLKLHVRILNVHDEILWFLTGVPTYSSAPEEEEEEEPAEETRLSSSLKCSWCSTIFLSFLAVLLACLLIMLEDFFGSSPILILENFGSGSGNSTGFSSSFTFSFLSSSLGLSCKSMSTFGFSCEDCFNNTSFSTDFSIGTDGISTTGTFMAILSCCKIRSRDIDDGFFLNSFFEGGDFSKKDMKKYF